MKKLIALFTVLCVCLILVGCNKDDDAVYAGNSRFEQVYYEGYSIEGVNSVDTVILVDKETGVMYLYVSTVNRSGLTVMVDEDGKPLIWEGGGNDTLTD